MYYEKFLNLIYFSNKQLLMTHGLLAQTDVSKISDEMYDAAMKSASSVFGVRNCSLAEQLDDVI